jgi:hypothetical protein
MPKDHLLYLRLKALGLAESTFTPEYPTPGLLALVSPRSYLRSFVGLLQQDWVSFLGPFALLTTEAESYGNCMISWASHGEGSLVVLIVKMLIIS